MDKVKIHRFENMPDLGKMDNEWWGMPKNWGLCIVGSAHEDEGLREGTHCVKRVESTGEGISNYVEHLYPIPDNVRHLMSVVKRVQDREMKDKIKAAIGI